MPSVCLYFQVHQPNRLKKYSFFEIGRDRFYEDDLLNAEILNKVSDKCYIPANRMMLELIKKHGKKFKIAYSLSGVFIEQCEHHRPDVIASFQELATTGCVEFLAETYYHSLAYLYSKEEFERQVKKHTKKIKELFGKSPKVFRNTELIYNNEIAHYVEGMGFKGIMAEGLDSVLDGRTPDILYKAPNADNIKTLLRNFVLSDDVAFRFSDTNWKEYPLSPEKYIGWLQKNDDTDNINIFIDYETIGEHHWEDSGIFDFWRGFIDAAVAAKISFKTPSEVIKSYNVKGVYDAHLPTSWADSEKDISAWKGNNMQTEALDKVYQLEEYVKKSKNKDLIHVWAKLQTSDHFYYMSTKHLNDGVVHSYFSPYDSPYDSYIYYVNCLSDLEISLEEEGMELGLWDEAN